MLPYKMLACPEKNRDTYNVEKKGCCDKIQHWLTAEFSPNKALEQTGGLLALVTLVGHS